MVQAILGRHRHRCNTFNAGTTEAAGMVCSGMSEGLVDVVELVDHPWYIVSVSSQVQSNPHDGHPLFNAFIAAGMKRSQA